MTLTELAVHYQKSGEMLPELAEYQIGFLLENIQSMFEKYMDGFLKGTNEGDFQDHVIYEMNDWLVDSGFGVDMDSAQLQEWMEEKQEEEYEEQMTLVEDEEDDQSH